VINSSVDRIQIESLPANRVIVASAELLHPLSLHLENPLVLNKCFTLADLLGIFICGVAAATAAMLTSPFAPLTSLRAFFTPCAAICTFHRSSRNRHRSRNNGNNSEYRCSQDVWGYRFPRVKLFHSDVNVLGELPMGTLPVQGIIVLIFSRLRMITLITFSSLRLFIQGIAHNQRNRKQGRENKNSTIHSFW